MREIKFRAWDKEYEKMTYFDDEGYDYRPPLIFRLDQVFKKDSNYDDYEDFEYNDITDKAEIMQYTGLHDKNGKEIYEGDIVKIAGDYELYGTNAGEMYEVYFAYGGFRLKPKYNSKARGYWLEDDNEVEVIGNVFENKELLNETDR